MITKRICCRQPSALAAMAWLAVAGPVAWAQPPASFNEREVKQEVNVQDTSGIWVLDFRFKGPRLIKVDIPGRGQKVVWYLWYQVTNTTGKPHTFIPDFELVTLDKPGVYHDQVLPKAQDAISALEDPTSEPKDRAKRIKNSVTIASEPIPPSRPDAAPRRVTGVAMWDDVNPDADRYSIFVAGLSNGWSVDDKGVVRRKTLQLNFRRLGDRYLMRSEEIHFVPPAEWLYRASSLKIPGLETAPKKVAAPPASVAPKPAPGGSPKGAGAALPPIQRLDRVQRLDLSPSSRAAPGR